MPSLDPQQQRQFALEVLEELRRRGFEAYWAGGCVRDCLLGRTPKDFDVATNATPAEIRKTFGRRRTLEIGAAFGVVAVVGPKRAGAVEVTTFRHDASYSDGRHPDAVTFSTAGEDAQRRDFTINGLFYDPLRADPEQRVIDFVGGVEDLQRRVIRAIGDPRARFAEDKLRLLRAVRFAATFEFALDAATRDAIIELAAQVTMVSPERIAQEMRLMLVHAHRARAVELLRETGLLAAVLPEALPAEETPEAEDDWRQTLGVLHRLRAPGFPTALAALFSRGGAPVPLTIADEACRRWRLSNKDAERVHWLLAHFRALDEARTMRWSRLQRLLIAEEIDDLLVLSEADGRARGSDAAAIELCRRLLELPAERLNPQPLLTGDDLVQHGVPQGKIYKRLLDAVRDAQLDGLVRTRDEALALVDSLRAEQG